jgi:hypothetical protein
MVLEQFGQQFLVGHRLPALGFRPRAECAQPIAVRQFLVEADDPMGLGRNGNQVVGINHALKQRRPRSRATDNEDKRVHVEELKVKNQKMKKTGPDFSFLSFQF